MDNQEEEQKNFSGFIIKKIGKDPYLISFLLLEEVLDWVQRE